jgi:hypothetical protein
MKWTRCIPIVVLVTVIAICSGCSEKAEDKIGFGTLENGLYRNKYFGMSVTLPNDWHALDDEARKRAMQEASKLIAGQDKNLQAALDASELNSVNLLMVYKHPLGTPVPFNPSLTCVAEKVSHLPGIKNAGDYLYHMRKAAQASQVSYNFGRVYSENIGGVDFDVQDMTLNVGTWRIQQKCYANIMKGYALGFVTTASNRREQQALNDILATVYFRKQ